MRAPRRIRLRHRQASSAIGATDALASRQLGASSWALSASYFRDLWRCGAHLSGSARWYRVIFARCERRVWVVMSALPFSSFGAPCVRGDLLRQQPGRDNVPAALEIAVAGPARLQTREALRARAVWVPYGQRRWALSHEDALACDATTLTDASLCFYLGGPGVDAHARKSSAGFARSARARHDPPHVSVSP